MCSNIRQGMDTRGIVVARGVLVNSYWFYKRVSKV